MLPERFFTPFRMTTHGVVIARRAMPDVAISVARDVILSAVKDPLTGNAFCIYRYIATSLR